LEDADIVFTVFDMLTLEEFADQLCDLPYTERRNRFVPTIQAAQNPNITYLENVLVENEEDAVELFGEFRKAGFEGLILKDPNGTYDFKRNRTWMKMKPSETMDVEITGYEEGKKGKTIGRLGAFTFEHNGLVCKCGGGYSEDERKDFWDNRDKMIGDLIEVQFMEKTAKGRTRHCNFVKLRTYKGEKV
jgi:DNA ligase-1